MSERNVKKSLHFSKAKRKLALVVNKIGFPAQHGLVLDILRQ